MYIDGGTNKLFKIKNQQTRRQGINESKQINVDKQAIHKDANRQNLKMDKQTKHKDRQTDNIKISANRQYTNIGKQTIL